MNSMKAMNRKARKVEETVIAMTGDVQALQASAAGKAKSIIRWAAR